MKQSWIPCFIVLLWAIADSPGQEKGAPWRTSQGNRLAYLEEVNPYYPSRTFPKLITPQWVGEEGVEAVVILGIDDMRDHKKYEAFLRPILNRLKEIDGRAPVSIMTCSIDPQEPHLQKWLKEGLSLECHSYDHPCPWFKGGFEKAKGTYDKCVDLMHQIPNSKPVAFRVPCCDSMNTPSPRFYAEIFNKTTPKKPSPPGGRGQGEGGNFLQIDTSVFNVFTSSDQELPRELVLDEKGRERFKKYLPLDRSFVNYIEDYPYPYVIGRLCWQFPCVTPSDWQAQHLHKPNNPQTVKDWKAALDCTVIKQGVFCLVFHPHGWIKNDQVVELIDYAVEKHGKKVKFLTFKEALARLEKNLLQNQAWRLPPTVLAKDFIVLDLNGDGFMDLMFREKNEGRTRIWQPRAQTWVEDNYPLIPNKLGLTAPAAKKIGILPSKGLISALTRYPSPPMGIDRIYQRVWHFDGNRWREDQKMWQEEMQIKTGQPGLAFFFLDLDGDGSCEMIFPEGPVLTFSKSEWKPTKVSFPALQVRNQVGFPFPFFEKDLGIRFLDLDGDGQLDILYSNEKEYGIYLFENMEKGWSRKVLAGKRSDNDKDALPMISKNGTNNGFFVHSNHLWWANEDTVLLKDYVDRRSIKELLALEKKE